MSEDEAMITKFWILAHFQNFAPSCLDFGNGIFSLSFLRTRLNDPELSPKTSFGPHTHRRLIASQMSRSQRTGIFDLMPPPALNLATEIPSVRKVTNRTHKIKQNHDVAAFIPLARLFGLGVSLHLS
jgi:hypothetical protein